jgi:hypothetical protein
MRARMEDHTLIPKVGLMLWGPDWQAPMAAALKQPVSAVSDWGRGRRPVPAAIWKELREIVRLHGLKLADLDPEIVRAYDTAIALASKVRT